MEKHRGKTLLEWKDYIKEDDYLGIRTAKYIIVLEEIIDKLSKNKMKLESENSNDPQSQSLLTSDVIKNKWVTLSDDEKNIMGRPNFQCGNIAHRMRAMGFDVATKAEDEQALVIFTMLEFHKEHDKDWSDKMNEFLNNV